MPINGFNCVTGNKVQYRNVPLSSEKYYTAFQRMVSDDNDHESLDWIQPIKTPRETSHNYASAPNLALILGLVFAFLVISIVIAIGIYKFLNRKKRMSPNASTDALEMYPEREVFEPPERPRRPVHY